MYIETPGLSYERHPMYGFIAHLDYNLFSKGIDLQFAMFLEGREMPRTVALPFGEGGILEAMDRVDQVDSLFGNPNVRVRYIGSRDVNELPARVRSFQVICVPLGVRKKIR